MLRNLLKNALRTGALLVLRPEMAELERLHRERDEARHEFLRQGVEAGRDLLSMTAGRDDWRRRCEEVEAKGQSLRAEVERAMERLSPLAGMDAARILRAALTTYDARPDDERLLTVADLEQPGKVTDPCVLCGSQLGAETIGTGRGPAHPECYDELGGRR